MTPQLLLTILIIVSPFAIYGFWLAKQEEREEKEQAYKASPEYRVAMYKQAHKDLMLSAWNNGYISKDELIDSVANYGK